MQIYDMQKPASYYTHCLELSPVELLREYRSTLTESVCVGHFLGFFLGYDSKLLNRYIANKQKEIYDIELASSERQIPVGLYTKENLVLRSRLLTLEARMLHDSLF
jgi:hypothetical protein